MNIDDFIADQERLADVERDSGVKHGMTKVIQALVNVRPMIVTSVQETGRKVRFVSAREAARFYGIHYTTLLRRKKMGAIKFIQPCKGGKVLYEVPVT
ncbi:MAG: hypothetical protein JXR25_16810 [Pontiellaceae bacterium]|nr:hypothetical protein [Pontiellaceae bacterium]MBN2786484.1 hypothetical protein [Pontiellaceae bacterium]